MRVAWIFTVPVGFLVLLIGGLPAMFNVDQRPDPDEMDLTEELDYQWKSEGYAKQGRKQEALDICTAMETEYGESPRDLCLLEVYDISGDIDGEIAVYEKSLKRELADGDSGALTRHVLEGLKEERDKKR